MGPKRGWAIVCLLPDGVIGWWYAGTAQDVWVQSRFGRRMFFSRQEAEQVAVGLAMEYDRVKVLG